MLRKLRIVAALIFTLLLTLLFLDFTGTIHAYFSWMARIQLVPALLALNVGIIVALVLLTFVFGRLYCSVICPLGVFQDVVSRLVRRRGKRRFSFSPEKKVWRYGVLTLFVVALIAGLGSMVALLDPYGLFGRMAAQFLSPLYLWLNNLLAYVAERADSYQFYSVEVWMTGIGTLVVALVSLGVVGYLAWRGGRTYCNTICPVGTLLGFVSRFSIFKHRFIQDQCNQCGLCARSCKASCIDLKHQQIDYSRCVSCFDCVAVCRQDAMHYTWRLGKKPVLAGEGLPDDGGRRNMLAVSVGLLATTAVKAQEQKMDGGLAYIEDKKIPKRQLPLVPPGSLSTRNFTQKCVACQLCVTQCPNQVLRPSSDWLRFMQPEMSYERGYCRPECTRCSEVCPTGAILPMDKPNKVSTQIGHAVWVEKNCVVLADGVFCDNCAHHCPVAAIQMVDWRPGKPDSPKIPAIDTERCIGCGACENLCPARPFTAIYVEGHAMHRLV